MLHCMLRYAEVYTNLICIEISAMPLELRIGGVKIDTDQNIEDGAYTSSVFNHNRSNKVDLSQWINHTEYELLTFNDKKQSKLSIDKITQLSLCPPEFWCIIDMVGNYYRWFYIEMKHKINSENM